MYTIKLLFQKGGGTEEEKTPKKRTGSPHIFVEKEVIKMTKKDVLSILEEYSTTDVRNVTRALRDDYEYPSLRVSLGKDALLDELEESVPKEDVVAAANDCVPGWDESEESDDDDSDDFDGEDGEED